MDIPDLITQLGALPGQVPDVEEHEVRHTKFVRSTVFDNPPMLDLYRAQGLPVDALRGGDAFIIEPEDVGDGPPVLFEVGATRASGGLEMAVTGLEVCVDLSAPEEPPVDGILELEIVRLRSGGVATHRYSLPAPAGRVLFLADPEIFGLRTTLFVLKDGWRRPLVFGPRLNLSRAK
ncbi:hypothetical protein KKD52_11860 [Myxococcota bacterium]|jgi:hypothetical protein|nr:hypothetical protein [Myxococcota bacterium]MBU1412266.1 hypothetical protein [Myxococcota bacterium]MBU1511050.1 hypothetical protein [Myxococcota bacterium]PKN25204.1 MAG: hypothetical protein CVU65_09465 [Deltaproteobacteria bacterium HGW-Deltaproteobacteria-22]